MKYQYDLLVIGSGSAGFSAALEAKGMGRKIGIVEKEARWGGECPNWACVPTKVMLKSVRVYRDALKAQKYGVSVSGVKLDYGDVQKRRASIVGALGGKRVEKIADDMGFDVIKGVATFLDPHTILVDDKEYTSERFVIATGTSVFVPPIMGISDVGYVDFRTVIELERLPKSIMIVGGGPVGCEFATYLSAFGVKVILVQGAGALLNREEPEISEIVLESLEEIGVDVYVGAEVVKVENSEGGVDASVRIGSTMRTLSVSMLMLATGKTSNTVGLGLKAALVDTDERGRIIVNTALKTTQKHIWAAGDVDGGMQFTHTAHREGAVAGHNAFSKANVWKYSDRVVPRATFVDPEVASVGLTEVEAKKNGAVLVGSFDMRGLGRSFIDGVERGIVKLVVDKKTRAILGGHVCGPNAGEIVHEIALAMQVSAKIDDITSLIHAYPTYSEAVVAAAAGVK